MYTIKCDNYPLFDLRDEELIVVNPRCLLATNTVGSASFTIYSNHPYYNKLKKLKSIFEISDEIGVIFRGRMTNDTLDFYKGKAVDLEGLMAFLNDSYIEPFNFPEDFLEDEEYIASENVIKYFLGWVLSEHNAQTDEFQHLKLGNVTVTDANNYLSRSSTEITSSWEIIKSKLFESSLGGYLCVRYEEDGNYIDYLSEFELTNTQDIEFGENLLDLIHESDAQETYSVIVPIGAEIEEEIAVVEEDEIIETSTAKKRLTLESIADGDITEDIVKEGKRLYSRSARHSYGLICAPVKETTWNDITDVQNLLAKSIEYLSGKAIMLSDAVEITAVDLHFTDEEIRSFRIYRNINVKSKPHGISATYQLTKLDIDLMNPQNTKITVGDTKLTLTDQANKEQSGTIERIESAEKDIEENRNNTTEIKNIVIEQQTTILNTCTEIIFSAMESYTETGDFEEFKQTTEAALKMLSDEMTLKFTETTSQITNVNNDLQNKFNIITKYFTFNIDGLTIGQSDSAYKVVIDNDRYSMIVNGVEVLWLDPDGNSNIPLLSVNKKFNLFGYEISLGSHGNLNCIYGGEREYIAPVTEIHLYTLDGMAVQTSDGYQVCLEE